MKRTSSLPCLIALFLWSSQLFAQAYPVKPVKIVVPYSAGGGTDIVARAVGQKLNESWGQSVLVENRAGASGMAGRAGRRETAFFFSGNVRKRTEHLAADGDSRHHDARRQNLGAVRRDSRPQ